MGRFFYSVLFLNPTLSFSVSAFKSTFLIQRFVFLFENTVFFSFDRSAYKSATLFSVILFLVYPQQIKSQFRIFLSFYLSFTLSLKVFF